METPQDIAAILHCQGKLGLAHSLLICNPVPEKAALSKNDERRWIAQALNEAKDQGINGKGTTPFLLKRLVDLSGGASLQANLALVKANVRLAAQIARCP